MKIIYLYEQVHGFTIATVKELINLGFEVHIITRRSNFIIPKIPNLFIYTRDNLNFFSIHSIIKKINPNLICVTGWTDKAYLINCAYFKLKKIPIVVHSDNTWRGTYRNYFASFLGFFNFFNIFFNFIWIHGPKQQEYVLKIGFKKKQLIYDHASADLALFHKAFKNNLKIKRKKYPKVFLYVGRLTNSKGINLLLETWGDIHSKIGWKLKIIGTGPIQIKSNKKKKIIINNIYSLKNF